MITVAETSLVAACDNETLTHCWFTVGSASIIDSDTTIIQHWVGVFCLLLKDMIFPTVQYTIFKMFPLIYIPFEKFLLRNIPCDVQCHKDV